MRKETERYEGRRKGLKLHTRASAMTATGWRELNLVSAVSWVFYSVSKKYKLETCSQQRNGIKPQFRPKPATGKDVRWYAFFFLLLITIVVHLGLDYEQPFCLLLLQCILFWIIEHIHYDDTVNNKPENNIITRVQIACDSLTNLKNAIKRMEFLILLVLSIKI